MQGAIRAADAFDNLHDVFISSSNRVLRISDSNLWVLPFREVIFGISCDLMAVITPKRVHMLDSGLSITLPFTFSLISDTVTVGTEIYIAYLNGVVIKVDTVAETIERMLELHNQISFKHKLGYIDGSLCSVCVLGGFLSIRSVVGGFERQINVCITGFVFDIAISENLCVLCGESRTVCVVDLETGENSEFHGHNMKLTHAALVGQYAIIGDMQGCVSAWKINGCTAELLGQIELSKVNVTCAKTVGDRCLVGLKDGGAYMLSIGTGKCSHNPIDAPSGFVKFSYSNGEIFGVTNVKNEHISVWDGEKISDLSCGRMAFLSLSGSKVIGRDLFDKSVITLDVHTGIREQHLIASDSVFSKKNRYSKTAGIVPNGRGFLLKSDEWSINLCVDNFKPRKVVEVCGIALFCGGKDLFFKNGWLRFDSLIGVCPMVVAEESFPVVVTTKGVFDVMSRACIFNHEFLKTIGDPLLIEDFESEIVITFKSKAHRLIKQTLSPAMSASRIVVSSHCVFKHGNNMGNIYFGVSRQENRLLIYGDIKGSYELPFKPHYVIGLPNEAGVIVLGDMGIASISTTKVSFWTMQHRITCGVAIDDDILFATGCGNVFRKSSQSSVATLSSVALSAHIHGNIAYFGCSSGAVYSVGEEVELVRQCNGAVTDMCTFGDVLVQATDGHNVYFDDDPVMCGFASVRCVCSVDEGVFAVSDDSFVYYISADRSIRQYASLMIRKPRACFVHDGNLFILGVGIDSVPICLD
ncbi:hypothetical protein PCE1_000006 [Barthelona sp. PCE]